MQTSRSPIRKIALALAISGLVTAFVWLLLVPYFSIKRVLSEDLNAFREAKALAGQTGNKPFHHEYAKRMSEISLAGTPANFRMNFRKHQEAWQALAALEDASVDLGDVKAASTLLIKPEPFGMLNLLSSLDSKKRKRDEADWYVAWTWGEVTKDAAKYGIVAKQTAE